MSVIIKPLIALVLSLILGGCTPDQPTPADSLLAAPAPEVLQDLPREVRSFIERKQQLALALAKKQGVKPDRPTLEYFRLARNGRYRAASHIFQDLRERGGKVQSKKYNPDFRLPLWDPLVEVQLTLDAYAAGAGKFATAFGETIVQSIPPGSIYFGGTDTGRGLPAAFLKSDVDGGSFFVLTQNQLADGQHLNYLRAVFGEKIHVLTSEDVQKAFQDYHDDAKRRYEHDQKFPGDSRQLRPGEDVKMVDGKPQVSGQVAVMMINGLLAKVIFDQNPDREFFVEESFPLDWMNPHLTPHGLIMKINRQPLSELTPEIVGKDHAFWKQRQSEFIGDWLKPETSVQELCAFVVAVFVRKDLSGFRGDPDFVRNYYAMAAYSKLRTSQAGLYSWRGGHSRSREEQQRMLNEADFAFRQSFAFCPGGSEAVFRYVNLLLAIGRVDDSLLLVQTAAKVHPAEKQFETLIQQLEGMKRSAAK